MDKLKSMAKTFAMTFVSKALTVYVTGLLSLCWLYGQDADNPNLGLYNIVIVTSMVLYLLFSYLRTMEWVEKRRQVSHPMMTSILDLLPKLMASVGVVAIICSGFSIPENRDGLLSLTWKFAIVVLVLKYLTTGFIVLFVPSMTYPVEVIMRGNTTVKTPPMRTMKAWWLWSKSPWWQANYLIECLEYHKKFGIEKMTPFTLGGHHILGPLLRLTYLRVGIVKVKPRKVYREAVPLLTYAAVHQHSLKLKCLGLAYTFDKNNFSMINLKYRPLGFQDARGNYQSDSGEGRKELSSAIRHEGMKLIGDEEKMNQLFESWNMEVENYIPTPMSHGDDTYQRVQDHIYQYGSITSVELESILNLPLSVKMRSLGIS